MSVTFFAPIVPRMWRGYDNPSYPVGSYIGHGVVVGDVSGGVMQVVFNFKEDGQPVSGRFYNIEQVSSFMSFNSGSPIDGFIRILGFESLGPFIIADREYRYDLVGSTVIVSAGQNFPPLPLFIGTSGRLEGTSSEVQFGTVNLSVVAFSVDIQGYIWEPRSILAEGGLKRAADVLYGR